MIKVEIKGDVLYLDKGDNKMYRISYNVKEEGTETASEKAMNQDVLLRMLGMITDEVKLNGKNKTYTKIIIGKGEE